MAFPFLVAFIARTAFKKFNNARQIRLFEQMPDALDTVSRSMAAGLTPQEAFRVVSKDAPEPTRAEFVKLSQAIAVGTTIPEAIEIMAENNKIAEYKFLSIAVSIQASAGGSIGDALSNVSRVVRERLQVRLRGRAMTGEARASAAVLSLVPLVSITFLLISTPSYMGKLFFTVEGRHFFGIAVIMIMIGRGIMTFMMNRVLSNVK
jgi:tight adherence protein B